MIVKIMWALGLVLIMFTIVRAETGNAKVYDQLAKGIAELQCPRLKDFSKREIGAALADIFESNGSVKESWIKMMSARVWAYSDGKAKFSVDKDNIRIIPGAHEHFLVSNGSWERKYAIHKDVFEEKGFLLCEE